MMAVIGGHKTVRRFDFDSSVTVWYIAKHPLNSLTMTLNFSSCRCVTVFLNKILEHDTRRGRQEARRAVQSTVTAGWASVGQSVTGIRTD